MGNRRGGGPMQEEAPNEELITLKIKELMEASGGVKDAFEADLISQQIQTSLKLMREGHHTGQLKLITRALKEMRYAYRIFNQYPKAQRISIFGSARTPETHPDYKAAAEFSHVLAEKGWMCITGAAEGIMKAGMTGLAPEGSFGLSIRLPFEASSNVIIEGDPKLIHFRYFFTRKLMFMSHSDAIAVFPGGYGTMDELFEMLTLMQTGKANLVPIVLLEGHGGHYWVQWEQYVEKNLLGNGWISADDRHMYYIGRDIVDGVDHILRFYHRYHSSRYVKDNLVIRLKTPIAPEQLEELNEEFQPLVKSGKMELTGALPEEGELPDLPRLVFHHTRKNFGLLRCLMDRLNAWD